MGDKTGISWAEATWNPVSGCTKVSPGCDRCYAENVATRFAGTAAYPNGFAVTLHPARLSIPLRWDRPRMVFVNSMSDLFHPDISDAYIAEVFAVMALAHRHTFQVLTKRHARMRSLLSSADFWNDVASHRDALRTEHRITTDTNVPLAPDNPLPNVWMGVTVENQKWADIRIPVLLDTPAAVRFLSCEPLLGPIDLYGPADRDGHRPNLTYWLTGRPGWGNEGTTPNGLVTSEPIVGPRLDWVIVGGESGSGARPMHPDWARTLRDQCAETNTAFHFKQWGRWAPGGAACHIPNAEIVKHSGAQLVTTSGELTGSPYQGWAFDDKPGAIRAVMAPVGKRHSGEQLDGEIIQQFPGHDFSVEGLSEALDEDESGTAESDTWPFKHVGLFCDRDGCDTQISSDIRADTIEQAYAGLRAYASTQGWRITANTDECPGHPLRFNEPTIL